MRNGEVLTFRHGAFQYSIIFLIYPVEKFWDFCISTWCILVFSYFSNPPNWEILMLLYFKKILISSMARYIFKHEWPLLVIDFLLNRFSDLPNWENFEVLIYKKFQTWIAETWMLLISYSVIFLIHPIEKFWGFYG